MSDLRNISVRPELVEGPFFFAAVLQEGRGFDKLSPNGVGAVRNSEVLA
ncbi:hypothetical protein P6144_17725 [Sphingomonas sp. HITSZ_GF]|nr:hypothetical protein [Sphingomonas sp. HITSZ_GF]MDG2535506.1 hypothetical protein [Sphingomonas sp. HITSZ_GF]